MEAGAWQGYGGPSATARGDCVRGRRLQPGPAGRCTIAQIQSLLQQLQDEAQRHSLNLTPVQINTDELYHVIRKRLFEKLPKEREVSDVAQAYAQSVREAKKMDITTQSPEQFAQLIQSSYPFHPAIRDLYARFRENQGFQQTRALIRLMRIITSRLWNSASCFSRKVTTWLISASMTVVA